MIPQGQFEDPPCRQEVTVTELLPSDQRDKHLDEVFSHEHRRDEGCDAWLTSWYDREVSFLSIPLALPPVTRNYLLLLERKLWLSVRSLKPTFNEWQVHFFSKKGSNSPLWFAFRLLMSAPEGDSPQTPTAIKAHPMIIMRRAQPAYRYYNLFPCLLVSFLLACIVQPSGATHRSQTAKKWTGPHSFSLEPSCNWQQTHTKKKHK